MLRFLVSIILCLSVCAPFAIGGSLQLIEGLPESYIPGQPVVFDVRLPAISNLGSYNMDLVLESTTGTAGVDYFFDVAATLPAAASYVFPSSANFFDAVNVDSPTRHRLTLTDFDLAGVHVVADQNDQVATIVLRTSLGFNGPLSLFIDAPSLILDTSDVVPTPVPGFNTIQTDIAAAGRVDLAPVPEPRSIATMLAGLALLLGIRSRSTTFCVIL
jgi:hypothetical protein